MHDRLLKTFIELYVESTVNEFTGVGAVVGYMLPLGMDPDAAGRQLNSTKRSKKKKRNKK